MKKIGFFGGTFDPIHVGHINLAISLLEIHKLDEILFCPAYVSPHKAQSPPVAPPEMRIEMVQMAIDPIPQFSLYLREVERGGSSFTIDTIKDLIERSKEEGQNNEYKLILGEDALPTLHRWKDVDELLTLVHPLVGCRGESTTMTAVTLPPFIIKTVEEGGTEIPVMAISSTMIRKRLKKSLYCGHLLSREVLDFIHQNELYLK